MKQYASNTFAAMVVALALALPAVANAAIDFDFTPQIPHAGERIFFETKAPGSFLWDFGDGATAAGGIVSHAYQETGAFKVRLQATTCFLFIFCSSEAVEKTIIVSPSFEQQGPTRTEIEEPEERTGSVQVEERQPIIVREVSEQPETEIPRIRVQEKPEPPSVKIEGLRVLGQSFIGGVMQSEIEVTTGNSRGSNPIAACAFSWRFGDPLVFSQNPSRTTATHFYDTTGLFRITYACRDTAGLTAQDSKFIDVPTPARSVNQKPVASFDFDPDRPFEGERVRFDASASFDPDGRIVEYEWDFDDGVVRRSASPQTDHRFNDDGLFDVVLTVKDSNGALHKVSRTADVIRIRDGGRDEDDPVADFDFSPEEPEVGERVSFDDESFDRDGSIRKWRWEFGDGDTSSARNPTHVYDDDGTFTVELEVTDDDGNTDTDRQTIRVEDDRRGRDEDPDADFDFSPSNPRVGETVFFDDESQDDDGRVVEWDWDFGDGSTSSSRNPTHRYNSRGSFTVTLRVTDDDGNSDTERRSITVMEEAGQRPVADFDFSPTNPRVDEAVFFDDNSFDSDGTITRWDWDFGDGSTSSSRNPTHRYNSRGSFTVTLRVTDDDRLTASTSRTVNVQGGERRPTAGFSLSPSNPRVGEIVLFNDNSFDPDGRIVERLWEFGDRRTSTAPNPTHSYSSRGTFTVTLTVTDDDRLTDTETRTITVGRGDERPVASFSFSPLNPRVGETVFFTDNSFDSDGRVISWLWNFGDGFTSSARNPVHSFSRSGTFTVTFTVRDDDGFSDSESRAVFVGGGFADRMPTAGFSFSPTSPRAGETIAFDCSSSFDPDGYITSCSWEFFGQGRHASEYGNQHRHIFDSAGTYSVRLTVRDNSGNEDTETRTVTVSGGFDGGGGSAPANFGIYHTPNNPGAGNIVNIYAITSTRGTRAWLVKVYADNSFIGSCNFNGAIPSSGIICAKASGPFSVGTHTYRADAYTSDGRFLASTPTVSFTVR